MNEEILIQISSQLKGKRKSQGITLQELANRAQVSKALISQIENNRTIPSLLVLINLIRSLGIDLNVFFEELVQGSGNGKLSVRRKEEYQTFYKEDAPDFTYRRILTKTIAALAVDIVLAEVKPQARQSTTTTSDAYEFKYVIKGEIECVIGEETHVLKEGDSLFFDGRIPHKASNLVEDDSVILIVYFFVEKV
ncbi:XRE family transcriptional regulator [Siphonobacter sp. BAB-5385]|uniref:helix-turn-helix domain-containing protein n=1 Tax=unclassified Siphonobacter TaxID=2635712 RepID=UPI000B9E9D88|nr:MULTISPECIES: XRE family transcriptional regulator [unclassified Siphonobacter]OZI10085.1 XRE family transcriptional regulator [Siphonobacter sp. BAB-5385]PMD98634.1 XRE family transcriptional regulator [Siphonobacter sp. BAB-5405]